jgi:hypothetical protein
VRKEMLEMDKATKRERNTKGTQRWDTKKIKYFLINKEVKLKENKERS